MAEFIDILQVDPGFRLQDDNMDRPAPPYPSSNGQSSLDDLNFVVKEEKFYLGYSFRDFYLCSVSSFAWRPVDKPQTTTSA